jgi:hypothetical protein
MPERLKELGPVVNTALEASTITLRVKAAEVHTLNVNADSVHVSLEVVIHAVPPFEVFYVEVAMLVEYLVLLALGQRLESIGGCHSGASS